MDDTDERATLIAHLAEAHAIHFARKGLKELPLDYFRRYCSCPGGFDLGGDDE